MSVGEHQASPNNLPLQLTSFVGREQAITHLTDLLSTTRLITLTGPGGCGKTRLAWQLAAALAPVMHGGVWWVDLATMADPALVAPAIATALGLQVRSDQNLLPSLIGQLQRPAVLLVLDNCEHLIEACARLSEALLRACPMLRLVATSRETLHVPAEMVWPVPPLVALTPGAGLSTRPAVTISAKGKGQLKVTPLAPQPEPVMLERLKAELLQRWPMTSLLDMLKEADLRVGFTRHLASVAGKEHVDPLTLQKRLLLCLYGLVTNTGLRRVSGADTGASYGDLRYVRRRFITREGLRAAIAELVNAIFAKRWPEIWGEGTTACASDSKKFAAWDQNLLTEWHVRYRGPGVMIYWHVERKAVCIHSQLKSCSSSEVAAMIEGVLRHCTAMQVDKNYVDSHGQSEVAFAFCRLLGFQLLPRLKHLKRQKLYRPEAGQPDAFPHLAPILTRPIDWELIRRQYDELVKYATALRLGTAEPEAILRRFTRASVQHPTYRALAELGKAQKTLFLCQYLSSEPLRREIHEGLNVIENWNSANGFIFYGRGGELATNRPEAQEVAMLCLHLTQLALEFVNVLMLQRLLAAPGWAEQMTPADWRALTPLLYQHVNPYGAFTLDLAERLPLDDPEATAA